jgi:SAM-dependent methyltransferase
MKKSAIWSGLLLGGLARVAVAQGPAEHKKHEGHHEGQSGHGGPLVHGFAKAEDWVKKFEGPERDAWQKPQQVVAALGDVLGKTVVDLGAGTGYFLPHLQRAVGETGKVVALDREPDMVRHLRARVTREKLATVEVRKVEGDDPGLAQSSVDRVLIVDVWHHIPERTAYAKKLAAALKPGGAIYVVDFTMASKHGPPKQHRLKPVEVVKELKDAGLAAEEQKSALTDQYIVVGRRAS